MNNKEKASSWWKSLKFDYMENLTFKYFPYKNLNHLTKAEIELIWEEETNNVISEDILARSKMKFYRVTHNNNSFGYFSSKELASKAIIENPNQYYIHDFKIEECSFTD